MGMVLMDFDATDKHILATSKVYQFITQSLALLYVYINSAGEIHMLVDEFNDLCMFEEDCRPIGL